VQAQARVRTPQIALIALTVITALIYFERAIQDPDLRILFILNGLGYFALLAAFYLPMFQRFRNAGALDIHYLYGRHRFALFRVGCHEW